MFENIKQRSVESYFIELNVPEDKKEKVLMAITDMVYSNNQRIIELEKETDIEKQKYLLKIVQEKESLIKQKINKVLAGEEEEITYDY